MKYKLHKLREMAPRDGFYITKPNGGVFWDYHPISIVKELNKLSKRINELESENDALRADLLLWEEKEPK